MRSCWRRAGWLIPKWWTGSAGWGSSGMLHRLRTRSDDQGGGAIAVLKLLEQRQFADRRRFLPGRKRGEPDQVVAVSAARGEANALVIAHLFGSAERALPAALGERGGVAVGVGEVDLVGAVY